MKTALRLTFNALPKAMGTSFRDVAKPHFLVWAFLFFLATAPGLSAQITGSNLTLASIDAPRNICGGNQNVLITVENQGPNQVNSFNVNWTIDGVSQSSYTFSGLLDTAGGAASNSTQLNIGVYTPVGTQQNIRIWTSLPNGTIDHAPSDDTLSLVLKQGLGGSYTLNPAGSGANNFKSFYEAGVALNEGGLCGPLTLNVSPGMYTGHLFLEDLAGSSATNTLTVDGGDSTLTHLTYASTSDSATIFLKGTDYVTIKNMTISNTSSSDGFNIMLFGLADYITVDSCKFVLPISSTTDLIHIIATEDMSGERNGNNANYTTIRYNTFVGGECGVTLDGPPDRPYNTGHFVSHNVFRFQNDHAIDIDGLDNLTILHNDIDSLTSSGADAVYLFDIDNFTIAYNRIVSPDYGLRISDGNDLLAVSSRSNLNNNMVISETDRAFMLDDLMQTNVYHNTLKGFPALYMRRQVNLDMRNNIFYSEALGVEIQGLQDSDIVDYNLYYSEAGTPFEEAGFQYTSLQEWQTVNKLHNQASIVGNPFFVGDNDLHLEGWFADGRADASVPVPDDIDGNPRSSTTPDIGADEFTPNAAACDSVTGLILNSVSSSAANISFDKDGDTYEIEWGACGFTQGAGTSFSGTSPITLSGLNGETCYEVYVRRACSGGSFTSWEGPYLFRTLCGITLSGTYTINKNLPGSSTNFQSFAEASSRLNNCGVNGPVVFNVSGDTYNEFMILNDVAGTDSVNTITFNGVDTTSTILTHDGSSNPFTISISGADYLTITNMKIEYMEPLPLNRGNQAIEVKNQSNFVTISNCEIFMTETTTQNVLGHSGINVDDDVKGYGNYLLITNNLFRYGRRSVNLRGRSGHLDSNVRISNNIMMHNSGPGVYAGTMAAIEINDNRIYGEGLTPPVSSPADSKYGLWLFECKNYNLHSNTMEVYGAGIRVQYNTARPSLPGANRIVNNMIYSNSTGVDPALMFLKADHVDVWHNTVVAEDTSALYLDDVEEMQIENNLLVSNSSVCVSSSNHFSVWSNVVLDYNGYYNDGAHPLAVLDTAVYQNFNLWKIAASGFNANSVFANPLFFGTTDLHVGAAAINNSGRAVGVQVDIDGDLRSGLFPDMGADEFVLPCTGFSSNGTVANITPTGAQISWISGPGAGPLFNVEYGVSGFTPGTGTELKGVPNPYNLTGLMHSTAYEFYVQDSCGTEGVSVSWGGPFSFTTGAQVPCDSATTLGATVQSTTEVNLSWSGGSSSNWNVEYGPTGFTRGSGTLHYNLQTPSLLLNTLSGSSCYDFYVQDSCGVGYVSGWSGPYNFCTQSCVANAGSDTTVNACLTDPTVNLATYLGGATPGGTWVDVDGSSALSSTGLFVFGSLVVQGTYRVAYMVTEPGCPNDTALITLQVDAAPKAGADVSRMVCDTVVLDLDMVLSGQDAGGVWLDVHNSGALSGSIVDFNGIAANTTYAYQYVLESAGCGNDTATVSIYVDSCGVGIQEYGLQGFAVYPNPSSGTLHLTFVARGAQAQLYLADLSGQLVYSKTLSNLNGTYKGSIDISDLATGTYLLTVESEGAQEVVRILRTATE